MNKILSGITCLLILCCPVVLKASGPEVDTTFKTWERYQFGPVIAIAPLTNGKFLVAGEWSAYGDTIKRNIRVLDKDGNLDLGFIPDKKIAMRYMGKLFPQKDGKIYISGIALNERDSRREVLFRLNPDASLDTSFHFDTTGIKDIDDIICQPDGKIIMGGELDSNSCSTIMRFNPDGSVDRTFRRPITDHYVSIYRLGLQSNGKIVVTGSFREVNGITLNNICRLNPNGSLDKSFVSKEFQDGYAIVNRLEVLADDRLFVMGSHLQEGQSNINGMFYLSKDGVKESMFMEVGNAIDFLRLPDGKMILSLNFGKIPTKEWLVKITNKGEEIDSFWEAGSGYEGAEYYENAINTMMLLPDNTILFAGNFNSCHGEARNHIARIDTSGKLLPFAARKLQGPDGPVSCIAQLPDKKIIIAGSFTRYAALKQACIVRLKPNGAPDSTFNAGIRAGYVNQMALLPDGKILVTGSFTMADFSGQDTLMRLNADGKVDASFRATDLNMFDFTALAVQPDGKILIAGSQYTKERYIEKHLLRLNANGSRDTTFVMINCEYEPGVEEIIVLPDKKILVYGDFKWLNNIPCSDFGRLHPDGSLDTAFWAKADYGSGTRVAFLPDGRLLSNPYNTDKIIPFLQDGTKDTLALSRPYQMQSRRIIPLSGGRFLRAGIFFSNEGWGKDHYDMLCILNADGLKDKSYHPALTTKEGSRAICRLADGRILVAGNFSGYNGSGTRYLMRLKEIK